MEMGRFTWRSGVHSDEETFLVEVQRSGCGPNGSDNRLLKRAAECAFVQDRIDVRPGHDNYVNRPGW
jgi:hypothetical protein